MSYNLANQLAQDKIQLMSENQTLLQQVTNLTAATIPTGPNRVGIQREIDRLQQQLLDLQGAEEQWKDNLNKAEHEIKYWKNKCRTYEEIQCDDDEQQAVNDMVEQEMDQNVEENVEEDILIVDDQQGQQHKFVRACRLSQKTKKYLMEQRANQLKAEND